MSDKHSDQPNPSHQQPDQARSQPGQNPGMPGKGPEGDDRANNPGTDQKKDKSRQDRDTAGGMGK